MLYYVRCIHIVSICNAKTITVSISGWRLWYILCLNCERIFLRIQGQCFTVLTRLSVQVIVGLKKIHIRPNRPKNEASELNVVLQLHYQVKNTHILTDSSQCKIGICSSLHAYLQQMINSFPSCSSVLVTSITPTMSFMWLIIKVGNLLHTFRMVSMYNQHYQWKIPTTLLALASQEWRWAYMMSAQHLSCCQSCYVANFRVSFN